MGGAKDKQACLIYLIVPLIVVYLLKITVFPHIFSAAKNQFIKLKIEIVRQYLNWLQVPNSKKNSFRGNYMRKYGKWKLGA